MRPSFINHWSAVTLIRKYVYTKYLTQSVFLTIGFTQKPAAEPFCIGLTTIADTACSSGWTCMSDFFKYFHVRSLITYYVQTDDLSCCSSGFLSYIGNGRKIFLIFYVYLLIRCGTHSRHVSLHLSLQFHQVPSLSLLLSHKRPAFQGFLLLYYV